MKLLTTLALLAFAFTAPAQEQIDKADARGKAAAALKNLSLRVRVTQAAPPPAVVRVAWRRGGEGLGGTVTRGGFMGASGQLDIPFGDWSVWTPLAGVIGSTRGWEFPTLVVEAAPVPAANAPKGKPAKAAQALTNIVVEFEFAENGKPFHRFTEPAPRGSSVGFAFPGSALAAGVTPEFTAQLNGLARHARLRRERLEALFPEPAPSPKKFALIGHLAGYGDAGGGGRGSGAGYGVRHCNPEILADECRTLRLLGVNSLVGSLPLADAAGFGADFRHVYWGGPGSGSPLAGLYKGPSKLDPGDHCPFDPALPPLMAETTQRAIAEHKAAGARESWALWVDEIGVFAKEHIVGCERCVGKFRDYLRAQKLTPADFGKNSWEQILPFNMWSAPPPTAPATKAAVVNEVDSLLEKPAPTKPTDAIALPPTLPVPKPAPAAAAKGKAARGDGPPPLPEDRFDALRYYYTFRFMTHATAQVFPQPARDFKQAGIPLYAMQGPTPSWSGASLDWHEFYDHDANTAFVFETSNRDARVWQWESYLADIGRGIADRHTMPMGCLVKPHRGAPEQRMLAVVARGTRVIEWYTYGPDYAKGDSFSQSPELLERVARAARFLGRGEEWLFGARPASAAEVAFVSPRATEIWGRTAGIGGAAFENAKWVYLALAHAHVPVDILSEAQLAEGKLARYKVIYVPGTHLRRDAATQLRDWVSAGGSLWTDAFGLARDEANQPLTALADVLGLASRKLETWGAVDGYRATDIRPFTETNAPAGAHFPWSNSEVQAAIGRESLEPRTAEILARFADQKPAVTRQRFGKGDATVAGFWSGLTYSAKVRRADFSMRDDFPAAVRALIAAPALARNVSQPARPSEPLVEALALARDGRRSIALINWAYQRTATSAGKGELQIAQNLRIDLPAGHGAKTVRSLLHGPLTLTQNSVTLPNLAEIDLLILE